MPYRMFQRLDTGQAHNADDRVMFDTTKERRLQPAEAPFLPCCRMNAAFLSKELCQVYDGAKLPPSDDRFELPGLTTFRAGSYS